MTCWTGFGDLSDGRPFRIGGFSSPGKDELLFWFPGDQNYWLGQFTGTQLTYTLAGNTAGFGGAEGASLIWVGDFSGSGKDEILFWFPGDGNWWNGRFAGAQINYYFAGNTGRPFPECVVIHFKSLLVINAAITTFIDTQFAAMEQLFASVGIAVYRGTTEDLSGNANLATLIALDVGACNMAAPTAEHTALFRNRNNAGADDLVIYVVQTLVAAAGNPVGCATHPDGQPGAAIVQNGAQWLLSHEVGHVLGLGHVPTTPTTNSDFLMWPNTGWTNVPPNITAAEASTMLSHALTRPC